ncbi:hypothetical protein AQJ11_02800 [Streptomyces corchorusii]|uniref:Uncharacterized protein n=2 Tax=Streptomyces TaxID=1883 RepID=A0A101QM53_STRCK|nr:hypothetical protein [Streptomyces corchorusii]KUN32470.1 hypothetical protein AQJ11_02800 [Streptomyces corchorusii]
MKDEITGVQYMDATVLRVTPLDEAGTPNHPRAMSFHLDEPVQVGVGTLEPKRQFGLLATVQGLDLAVGLVADRGPWLRADVQAIAESIWQERRTGAAVEWWAEADLGFWWYTLVPWWRHEWDTDRWPFKNAEDRQAYAVGYCRTVDAYDWPAPAPLRDPHGLTPGTQLVYARTPVEPPAPGLPPYPGAAA